MEEFIFFSKNADSDVDLAQMLVNRQTRGSSTFVLREVSGLSLKRVHEDDAVFYYCEIICALQRLHTMRIVHMDLKLENFLRLHSGHVLITDLDRSYDMSERKRPTSHDFGMTFYYMAPELGSRIDASLKADVWRLALLMAKIMSGSVRSGASTGSDVIRWARMGRYRQKKLLRPP
ncbi:putative ribosomal protein S6 kinase alpha-1 [Taenia solium]|eukprot:TsM_001189200 transcript=TsM_001189200 gene=TsM_001189200